MRMIPVRISRATTWTTEEGIQFRSAEAEVLIDCDRQSARYLNAAFYSEPDFKGQAFRCSLLPRKT
ncbi:surface-adhesin E family protein [Polaromonas sp. JS666]|uniref:surface-adhesin E family protein n=1 Tax=Polaromonas sp. (strain JS666 / ATCC BAA-500) TaxID=296591 RepID=UPI0026C23F24